MNKKMKPLWKKKWLAALPRYRQTKHKLRGKVGFCCLGVLADQVNPKGWSKNIDGDWQFRITPGARADEGSLSRETLGKTGLSEDAAYHLAGMNDGGKRFSTISEWIRENL